MSTHHAALSALLSNNAKWADSFESANPGFSFPKSAAEPQRPRVRTYLERATALM